MGLTRQVLGDWELSAEGDFRFGETAAVLSVRTGLGEPAALKLGWPHPEARHEHLALRAWAGAGAVRLLRADPHRQVLLLERLHDDRDLHSIDPVTACEVVAGLYQRLHRPALPQVDRLSALAEQWSAGVLGLRESNLVPRRFVEQASSLAADFARDPDIDRVLLHTDLHYANVLAADREPWLAIDPKPLAGDPAYEVAPLLWNRWPEAVASGNVRGALLDRLFAVVDAAELDEDRVRDWVTVRAVVNVWWSVQDGSAEPNSAASTMATTILKAVQR